MSILTKDEVEHRQEEIAKAIIDGKVFIHPTDTIYCIGGNATNKEVVSKIRKIKENSSGPLKVWAPSKEWIRENFEIPKEAEEWLNDKLPGSYTLVLKLKNKKAVADNAIYGGNKVFVKLPNHWFSGLIEALGIPIVSAGANKMSEGFMTNEDNLNPSIKREMDFIIYDGVKEGSRSRIVEF